jgi:hypothetical protein
MLKRVALLGAIAALTIASPSHAVAQTWGGWGGGVTINVGFPVFPRRDFCCRPRFPRPVFCCRTFFPRPVFCCRPFYRSFYRPWPRPPYYYGDGFAPYGYHYNAGYTTAGYGGYGDGYDGYGDGEP